MNSKNNLKVGDRVWVMLNYGVLGKRPAVIDVGPMEAGLDTDEVSVFRCDSYRIKLLCYDYSHVWVYSTEISIATKEEHNEWILERELQA